MAEDVRTLVVHTDGASRGNPGPASIGVVIAEPNGRVLRELGEAIPRATNNVAEYTAVIRALEQARAMGAGRVQCLMDSQLVVRQLNGSYKVKHADMLPLYRRVLELVQQFDEVTFAHVPREMNTEADRLANAALDSGTGSAETDLPASDVVRHLCERMNSRDWEGAAALLGDAFRYRRPAARLDEHDPDGFLRMVRDTELKWRIRQATAAGASVLAEVSTEDQRGNAESLLICEVIAGRIEAIAEFRDRGI